MSYGIVTVIYGVPITEHLVETLSSKEFVEAHKDEEFMEDYEYEYYYEDLLLSLGFETMYTASASFSPGHLGVELGGGSEGEAMLLSDFYKEISDTDKQHVEEKINKLPEAIKELLEPVDTYLVWSSS